MVANAVLADVTAIRKELVEHAVDAAAICSINPWRPVLDLIFDWRVIVFACVFGFLVRQGCERNAKCDTCGVHWVNVRHRFRDISGVKAQCDIATPIPPFQWEIASAVLGAIRVTIYRALSEPRR